MRVNSGNAVWQCGNFFAIQCKNVLIYFFHACRSLQLNYFYFSPLLSTSIFNAEKILQMWTQNEQMFPHHLGLSVLVSWSQKLPWIVRSQTKSSFSEKSHLQNSKREERRSSRLGASVRHETRYPKRGGDKVHGWGIEWDETSFLVFRGVVGIVLGGWWWWWGLLGVGVTLRMLPIPKSLFFQPRPLPLRHLCRLDRRTWAIGEGGDGAITILLLLIQFF